MSTEPNYKAIRAAAEELSPLHLSAIDNVGSGCYKVDGHGVFKCTDKKMCESIVTIVNTSIAQLDRIEELEARVKSEDEVRNAKPHDAFDALDIDYLCMLASHGSAVVRGGWLRTFAKKIKNALDALEAKDKEIERLKSPWISVEDRLPEDIEGVNHSKDFAVLYAGDWYKGYYSSETKPHSPLLIPLVAACFQL